MLSKRIYGTTLKIFIQISKLPFKNITSDKNFINIYEMAGLSMLNNPGLKIFLNLC